jgi:hypothetical protein
MMMDDDKIKALRERQVDMLKIFAKAEDAKQRSDRRFRLNLEIPLSGWEHGSLI